MCTEPKAEVIREALLIRTAGVRECRLCMSAPHRLVHFWDRRPEVKALRNYPGCV